MKVFVYTLGCKLNQCESEAIADAFVRGGCEITTAAEQADLCIVNTCTVTSKAQQKGRRMIRFLAAQPNAPIVLVIGCYANLEKEELEKLAQQVVVISQDDKSVLLRLPSLLATSFDVMTAIRQLLSQHYHSSPFDYEAISFSRHSRAFLKIEDGCDNACAYCQVTIARGSAVSLDVEEVVRRAVDIERHGYHEIVLTGVNISAYRSASYNLAALVERLLIELGNDMRIRLSSLEPDQVGDDLLAVCADFRVQPHFHVPVQSASDVVLRRANRHYDVQTMEKIIVQLRKIKDDPIIAADIIAGLPGETEKEFEQTVGWIEKMDLSQLHVFPYSPRPYTALYHAEDRVCESVRDERAHLLRNISAIHYRRYVERQFGREVELILEERQKDGSRGITGNYLKVPVTGIGSHVQPGALLCARIDRDAITQLPIARCIDVNKRIFV